ncbi:MAG: sensor histidine kinase [Verrucomicrobiota bacterium]
MKKRSSPIHEHTSVEHLAKVFKECREEILTEWRLHTGELLRDLKLDRATLTNHVPVLVDEIISDLSCRREASGPAEPMVGEKTRHGLQRVIDGLDVGEVVAEFNLLRTAFFTIMDRHDLYLVGEAARILNRRIDDSVRAAVTAFAEQQARNLKAKEDEHVAFIAHDLRTPLNAIVLLAEELKEGHNDGSQADSEETFELLKRNCGRVMEQIKGVMEGYAKSSGTEGTFQPQCRTFELWPIVQSLKVDFRVVAAKNGIQVVNQIPHLLTLWADAGLISLVIQNLLDNAFKHAPHGKVTIAADTDAHGVTCRVQDNGPGIPAEILPKIFEKHVTSSGESGSGLGLPIVKQIVEAHGGSVSVESPPGEGATFAFTVPGPREVTASKRDSSADAGN